jgi:hypothetical protein
MAETCVKYEIPKGYELAEPTARAPRDGEYYLDSDGQVEVASDFEADNDYCVPILRKLAELPAEYEFTGETRLAKKGELYFYPAGSPDSQHAVSPCGKVYQAECDFRHARVQIVRKIADITPPAGYEVAEPVKRVPKAGEWYMSPNTGDPKRCIGYQLAECVILRKVERPTLPAGWELAEPTKRKLRVGDHWLCPVTGTWCGPATASNVYIIDSPRWIVRESWTWPAWLKAEWIARDADGKWFGYGTEPAKNSKFWYGGTHCNLSMTDFTPPPCSDWRESKRRNPDFVKRDEARATAFHYYTPGGAPCIGYRAIMFAGSV